MRLVIGIIKPLKLDEVCASLSKIHVQDINLVAVKGYGHQRKLTEHYHGAYFSADFFDKVRLEFIVSDEHLPQAVQTIKTAANSGTIGDGKIFICEIN